MIRNCFFCFVLCLLVSCGNDNEMPPGILKPEKMQGVLWDIITAEAYTAEMIKTDSTKKPAEENQKLQQQVFSIHKITKDEFYNSYDYYKNNSTVFKVMLDSMIVRGSRKKNYNNNTIKITPAQAQ